MANGTLARMSGKDRADRSPILVFWNKEAMMAQSYHPGEKPIITQS